jgi:hypothetical protein
MRSLPGIDPAEKGVERFERGLDFAEALQTLCARVLGAVAQESVGNQGFMLENDQERGELIEREMGIVQLA